MTSPEDPQTEFGDYLAVVTKFCASEVAPRAAEIDRKDEWFPDLVAGAGGLGLQGILFDEKDELDLSRIHLADSTTEIIASYLPALGITLGAARLHLFMLSRYASPALREKWFERLQTGSAIGSMGISEPGSGSDIRSGRTVARLRDGEWVLNGAKAWTTLSPVSDFTIVLAKIETSARDADTGMFLVERGTEGFSYGENDPLISYRGVPMANTYFDDVRVSEENVMLTSGGFAGIMQALNFARLEASALGRGIIRGCLRLVSQYTAERVVFDQPLARHQATQLHAADMAIRLESARGLSRSAADSFLGEQPNPTLCAAAKSYAADAAMQTASEAVSLFGGYGVSQQFEIERYFRDAKATQIFDGTADVLGLQIGRWALSQTDW